MESSILTMNGKTLTFEPGQTILEAAGQNNIPIPTLCHLKNTIPTTTCRICVVEIEEQEDLVEACATPAQNGMIIYTESPKVVAERKKNIGKMLALGNHNCGIRDFNSRDWTSFQLGVLKDDGKEDLCPVWGDCELQDLAYRYQVQTRGLAPVECKYEIERANPFIIRDFSRCILCGRCIKACREIQVNNAIDFGYKGEEAKIITKGDTTLKDSDCVFCGECLQVCPVGALIPDKTYRDHRFRPTKKVRTTCAYCGVGCQMDVFVQDNKIVKIDGADVDLPPNNGSLCVKGRFGYHFVGSPERLTTPLMKKDGKQVPVSWKEAIDHTAQKLSDILASSGSDKLGVLTSARVTNEDNYIANKFARAVLKTNNIDHCARL